MKCILLAGGSGLRLWPLSRKQFPKQFLLVDEQYTMLQQAVLRNAPFCDSFLVVTGSNYRDIVEKQLREVCQKPFQILLETVGRNTAPAMALAALCCDPQELLLVVPADASILPGEDYTKAVRKAVALAAEGYIVTFGLKPTQPHTGYGYIRFHGNDVLEFKEKPDAATAQAYLDSKEYLWNSGMFLFQSQVFLSELQLLRPDILGACQALMEGISKKETCSTLPREKMLSIPAESVDYAVMERSRRIKVVPAYFPWSDIGNLEAFCELAPMTQEQNRSIGTNVILRNCKRVSVVNQAKEQLIVVNGLENVVIANTPDAIYISTYGEAADIKEIMAEGTEENKRFFE